MLGPLGKAYWAVCSLTSKRQCRWLCQQHKRPGQGTARVPEARLEQILGLQRLSLHSCILLWAKHDASSVRRMSGIRTSGAASGNWKRNYGLDRGAGATPVVLGSGRLRVLLHEALGHELEGDFNRKRICAFSDRLAEQAASPLCIVIGDGTIYERRGVLTVDDASTPAQHTPLIELGRLDGYVQETLNARLMGMQETGDGPGTMSHLRRVGNDLALDKGVGTCGKEGQSVPVGVGQPTLKVDLLTVGGTSV